MQRIWGDNVMSIKKIDDQIDSQSAIKNLDKFFNTEIKENPSLEGTLTDQEIEDVNKMLKATNEKIKYVPADRTEREKQRIDEELKGLFRDVPGENKKEGKDKPREIKDSIDIDMEIGEMKIPSPFKIAQKNKKFSSLRSEDF